MREKIEVFASVSSGESIERINLQDLNCNSCRRFCERSGSVGHARQSCRTMVSELEPLL